MRPISAVTNTVDEVTVLPIAAAWALMRVEVGWYSGVLQGPPLAGVLVEASRALTSRRTTRQSRRPKSRIVHTALYITLSTSLYSSTRRVSRRSVTVLGRIEAGHWRAI